MKKTFLTLALATSLLFASVSTIQAHTPGKENDSFVSYSIQSKGTIKRVIFILKDGRKAVISVDYKSVHFMNLKSKTYKHNVNITGRIFSSDLEKSISLNLIKNYLLVQKTAELLNIDLTH